MSEYPTCPSCGSRHTVRDAYAGWCNKTQQWKLEHTYDYFRCYSCGEEDINPIWITVDEQTPSNSEGQNT